MHTTLATIKITTSMKKTMLLTLLATALVAAVACGRSQKTAAMEGHYIYGHSFDYDFEGNHFDVSETGTMDFCSDGSALDSARQVYSVTFADGDTTTWVFNYVSPSRWHLEGDTLFFAGVKDLFRMELVEGVDSDDSLALRIAGLYGGSIDYEYHFHLDTLTADSLRWSFTYRDGHSDTWRFRRQ